VSEDGSCDGGIMLSIRYGPPRIGVDGGAENFLVLRLVEQVWLTGELTACAGYTVNQTYLTNRIAQIHLLL
jgi:hypothetical protein